MGAAVGGVASVLASSAAEVLAKPKPAAAGVAWIHGTRGVPCAGRRVALEDEEVVQGRTGTGQVQVRSSHPSRPALLHAKYYC